MESSGKCRHGHAGGPVFARALDRAGQFPRGAAAQVLACRRTESARVGVGSRTSARARSSRCAAPESRDARGEASDGAQGQGHRIHWVSAPHALEAEVRLYEHLFLMPRPDQEEDWKADIEPVLPPTPDRMSHRAVGQIATQQPLFERNGYFCVEPDASPSGLVFNRTVSMRDLWAKIEKATVRTQAQPPREANPFAASEHREQALLREVSFSQSKRIRATSDGPGWQKR